ncbi:MAG: hypothetical protein R6X02_15005 [Enhygromyxa sp.]
MLADDDDDDERTSSSPSARSSTRKGSGEVELVAPGLLHCRVTGYVRLEHVEQIIFTANDQIRKGYRPHLFVDGDDVHGYDTEVRKLFQSWAGRNRADIEGVWVLFRSPLVKMGLSIASALTGGAIRGFADANEFDKALAEATRKARAGGYRGGSKGGA